jgi:hypothetical protein
MVAAGARGSGDFCPGASLGGLSLSRPCPSRTSHPLTQRASGTRGGATDERRRCVIAVQRQTGSLLPLDVQVTGSTAGNVHVPSMTSGRGWYSRTV